MTLRVTPAQWDALSANGEGVIVVDVEPCCERYGEESHMVLSSHIEYDAALARLASYHQPCTHPRESLTEPMGGNYGAGMQKCKRCGAVRDDWNGWSGSQRVPCPVERLCDLPPHAAEYPCATGHHHVGACRIKDLVPIVSHRRDSMGDCVVVTGPSAWYVHGSTSKWSTIDIGPDTMQYVGRFAVVVTEVEMARR